MSHVAVIASLIFIHRDNDRLTNWPKFHCRHDLSAVCRVSLDEVFPFSRFFVLLSFNDFGSVANVVENDEAAGYDRG